MTEHHDLTRHQHGEYTIYTSGDARYATRAVVERGGELTLVDTVEAPYTDNEGAVYDPSDFVKAVVDAFEERGGQRVGSVEEAFPA